MDKKDFDKQFDVDYPAGRFDLSLDLIEGNPLIYRFFGSHVYYSLYKMLNQEEQEALSSAAQTCTQMLSRELCIHIDNGTGFDCYVLRIRKTMNAESYDIELFNVSEGKQAINELNKNLMLARDFLTLTGEAFFTYYPACKRFHLFFVSHSQTIDLFDMDIDAWMELLSEQKRIDEEDADTFETFCAVLKDAEVSQSYTFHGRVLSDQNATEKYRISFKPRHYEKSEIIVCGTWAVINETTSDVNALALDASYIDGLTGLLNKKAITEYAENAVNHADSNSKNVALAMMDVDNFKSVNDNYGHLFGDKVIQAVAEIIQKAIGTDAVAGRMGGDEFLIVFDKYEDELEYRNVLRYIKINVHTVFQNRFGENHLTCSIGLGRYGYGPCSTNYHDLFRIADRALYLAKQKGKNRYIIYKPELHGDFNSPDDSGDIVNIANSFYLDTDIEQVYSLISDTIIAGPCVIPTLLDCLAHTLILDRVNIFIGTDTVPLFQNSTAKGVCPANPNVLNVKKYVSLFTKNMLAISNIHYIEFTIPEVYTMLSDSGVSCLMQYTLRDRNGNVAGLVSADIFDRFSAFPKIATHLFDNMCRTINSVLIREQIIKER